MTKYTLPYTLEIENPDITVDCEIDYDFVPGDDPIYYRDGDAYPGCGADIEVERIVVKRYTTERRLNYQPSPYVATVLGKAAERWLYASPQRLRRFEEEAIEHAEAVLAD